MKRSVKFCPNCGSTNIKWLNPQMWSIWKCWDCGYIGAVVIEDGDMADEIRNNFLEKIKNEKTESNDDESNGSS
jgi:transcription factor S